MSEASIHKSLAPDTGCAGGIFLTQFPSSEFWHRNSPMANYRAKPNAKIYYWVCKIPKR